MAHELDFNETLGRHAFYSVKEKPWHGLGYVADDYHTPIEVIQLAGLNYRVEKEPNRQHLPAGTIRESDTSFFTYRTDTEAVLGDQLGSDYTIVQNSELFRFFDTVAGENNARIETAAAMFGGARVVATAKLPGIISVGNNDVTDCYLFMTNAHDGKSSVMIAFTPIRIVCNNTLNAAMANCSNAIRIAHLGNVHEELNAAARVLRMVNTAMPAMESTFQRWADYRVSDGHVKQLVIRAMADKETLALIKAGKDSDLSSHFKNTCEQVMDYYHTSETQQLTTTKGTLFGAYNAVTGFHQNIKKYKSQQEKVKNLLLGGLGQQRGQTAFDLCAAFEKEGALVFNN